MRTTQFLVVMIVALSAGCKTTQTEAENTGSLVQATASDPDVEPEYFKVQGSFSGVDVIQLSSFYMATSSLPGCWNLDLQTLTNPKNMIIDVPASVIDDEFSVQTFTGKQGICRYAWRRGNDVAVSLHFTTPDGYTSYIGFKSGVDAVTSAKVRCKRHNPQTMALVCSVNGSPYGDNRSLTVSFAGLDEQGVSLNVDIEIVD